MSPFKQSKSSLFEQQRIAEIFNTQTSATPILPPCLLPRYLRLGRMSSLTENIIRRPPTTANLTVAVVTGVTLATIFSKAVSKTLDATWNALDETMLEYQPRASLARYAQKLGDIERTICELEFSLGVQRLATDTRPPCSSAAKSEEVQTVYELKLRLVKSVFALSVALVTVMLNCRM